MACYGHIQPETSSILDKAGSSYEASIVRDANEYNLETSYISNMTKPGSELYLQSWNICISDTLETNHTTSRISNSIDSGNKDMKRGIPHF